MAYHPNEYPLHGKYEEMVEKINARLPHFRAFQAVLEKDVKDFKAGERHSRKSEISSKL